MQTFSEPGLGTESGPPSASAYKRAVYKQAPSLFSIEVLPPQKQGNNYSYGMRITPHKDSDRQSTISINSGTSSTGSLSEYDVWRRWEDCLYFQDILETQYGIMSREKRSRLQAGKGVKKNGVYPHEDPYHLRRAASFESLPPGPDPNMIAKDVHEFLPRLTKKGTLFRASAGTIEQRGMEFKMLIEALFKEGEDVPTLIVELRQLRVVRDFFGFWRRDHDRVEKERAREAGFERRRNSSANTDSMISGAGSTRSRNSSLFGSAFGMYFSASNLSLQLPSTLATPEGERVRYPIVRGGSLSRPGDEFGDIDADEREGSSKPRSSRRPHTMQSGSSSDFLRSRKGSTSTAGSSSSSQAPLTPISSQSYSAHRPRTQPQPNVTSVRAPPASAPAGMRSFASISSGPGSSRGTGRPHPSTITSSHRLSYDDDEYNSDTPSVPDSVASLATFHTQTTERQRPPRSAPPQFMSMQVGMAGSNVSLGSSLGFGHGGGGEYGYAGSGKGKGKASADLEPEFDAGLRLGDEEEENVDGGGYVPVPVGTHHSPPSDPVIVPFATQNEAFDIPLDISNRRGSLDSNVDPILPKEGDAYDYDDDGHTDLVMREHKHLIPQNMDGTPEEVDGDRMGGQGGDEVSFEFGGVGGVRVALQDLIEEEEEELAEGERGHGEGAIGDHDNTPEVRTSRNGSSTPTPSQIPGSPSMRDRSSSSPLPTAQPIPRTQRRTATVDISTANRNGLVFTSPYLAATELGRPPLSDDETTLSTDDDISLSDTRRPSSIEAAMFSNGDSLVSLVDMETAKSTPRVTSPVSTKVLTPGSLSPVGTPTMASIEVDHKRILDDFGLNGSSRPISTITQSSTDSSIDLAHRFSTASSVVLHSPLFDLGNLPDRPLTPLSDSEIEDRNSAANRLSQFSGSMTSIDSVVSDGEGPTVTSIAGAGLRRSMSPPPSTISSRLLSDNLRRSLSSGSRRPKRISQLSIPGSVSSADIEDELLESYFHGGISPTHIPSAIAEEPSEPPAVTPGREHFRGALPHPTNHPKPFQNRPPGQFHLPWTPPLISTQILEKQQRRAAQLASPPASACSNNSFISIDSPSITPSTAASSTYPDETSGSAGADNVAIKAVVGDSIVKFRSDRSVSLRDVRAKLWEKFVKEQDVPLSENFSLAYMPASGGRLMALKYAGRMRSNSVSSAGTMDPNQLRYIFSEKEWQDAMSCCGPKLNLHVFNDKL